MAAFCQLWHEQRLRLLGFDDPREGLQMASIRDYGSGRDVNFFGVSSMVSVQKVVVA